MSTTPPDSTPSVPPTPPVDSSPEFEFSDSQNSLIGDLARKMGLVGFVLMIFGVLQMVNGITTLIASRNPDRIVAAAKEAGVAAEQIAKLEAAFSDGSWASPFVISAIAFIVAGLILLLVGVWTGQAAGGFAGIVVTQGKDITRLMGALEALHKKYGLMYYIIWIAAIASLISIIMSVWHMWGGGGGA